MYIFKTFVLILQSFREWSKESYGGEFYLTYWYIEWFLCYNVVYNVFFTDSLKIFNTKELDNFVKQEFSFLSDRHFT